MVPEIIKKEIEKTTQVCIDCVRTEDGFPQTILLYDDQGNAHGAPPQTQQLIFDPKHKGKFVGVVKQMIDYLKKEHDINIVATTIFQNVFYSTKTKEEVANIDRENYKPSEDSSSDEAVMVIIETKEHINYKIYQTIYTDDRKDVVISETPTSDDVFTKAESKEVLESWMLGLFD